MRGYFDESGTHDQSRVTTIAGWVANAAMWRKCLIKWQAALESKKINAFHGNRFDHFTRVSKWSSDEYSDFVETLTDILAKYTSFGVSGSVLTSAYDNLPEWVRQRIGGRYHFCFHVVMHQLIMRLDSIIAPDALTLYFEHKDHIVGKTRADFKVYSAQDYHNQLDGLFFGTKERVPLLQTADFLVYEMNK